MADGLPDEILWLLAGTPPGSPVVDPVAAQASMLDDATTRFVVAPQSTFLGQGALDAASGPPGRDGRAMKVRVSFDISGQSSELDLVPEAVEDLLIALYTASGWDGVQAFLTGLGRRVFHVESVAPTSRFSMEPTPDPPALVEQRNAYATAVTNGLATLNGLIADTLVEFSTRATQLGFSLAADAMKRLTALDANYGIRLKRDESPVNNNGAGGGGGSDPGTSGAEGGPGRSQTEYEVRDPLVPGAAEDLVVAIKALGDTYSRIERAKTFLAMKGSTINQGAPSGGGTAGTGAGGGAGGGGSPAPDPYSEASLADDIGKFQTLLKAAIAQHRIVPGVLALCLPERSDTDNGSLEDQVIYAQVAAYLQMATGWLRDVPETMDSTPLRAAMTRSLHGINRSLQLDLKDVPEVRAAVWAGRSERSGAWEPLLAEQLLDRVRVDIVEGAAESGDEADAMRAAFAVAVLTSYLRSADASVAVRTATLAKAESSMLGQDKSVAALSLMSLLVPPIRTVTLAIGLMTMAGHAMNQFTALASSNRAADAAALDALLADDSVVFVTILSNKPRFEELIGEIAKTMTMQMVFDTVFPVAGLVVQVASDVATLLE